MRPNPVIPIGGVLLMWWTVANGDTDLAVMIAAIVAIDVAWTCINYRREVWRLRCDRGERR
jgi:hypothetical protein